MFPGAGLRLGSTDRGVDEPPLDEGGARRAWQLAMLERKVLGLLAEDRPASAALDELAVGLERIAAAGTLASILILEDDGTLRMGSAPHLAAAYNAAIDGAPIGPSVGSCGTAAFRAEPVVVTDIETDPLWDDYRELALSHGLRACWSVPILSTGGDVLGTFAFYYDTPRAPDAGDLASIDGAARLARIVLERARADRATARMARRKEALFGAASVLAVAEDVDQALDGVLAAVCGALGWTVGTVWLVQEDNRLSCAAAWASGERVRSFLEETRRRIFPMGGGLPGRVCRDGEAEWLAVRADDPRFPRGRTALEAGLVAGVGVPIVAGSEKLGALELFTSAPERFDGDLIMALRTVCLQIAQFIGRARVQAQREQLLAEMREAVRFSELFSTILAHDLRVPLNGIALGTDLLLGSISDEDARETLSRMKSSKIRMARMIEQLLNLSRSRSTEGITAARAPCDVGVLARAIAQEIKLGYPQRVVTLRIEGDTQGSWDGDKLGQVLSNLLGNAIQHGAAGGEISLQVDGREPDEVVLITRNAGEIPAEHLRSLFDPFRSLHPVRSRKGLGLGLYITRLIVDAHGGRVSVDSSEGETTFHVRLPRQ